MINRNRLRGLMAEKNITQAKLAKAIGISVNAFNMKLKGKTVFNENEIKSIANYFNVATDFLFTN